MPYRKRWGSTKRRCVPGIEREHRHRKEVETALEVHRRGAGLPGPCSLSRCRLGSRSVDRSQLCLFQDVPLDQEIVLLLVRTPVNGWSSAKLTLITGL
jgi:hypothetical protein